MTIRFEKLLAVRVHHAYFLDLGATAFSALSAEQQVRQEAKYAVENFLRIVPTLATESALAAFGLIFKITPTGFLIAKPNDLTNSKPTWPIDFRLQFMMKLVDPNFLNYTDLYFNSTNFQFEKAQNGYGFLFSNENSVAPSPQLSVSAVDFIAQNFYQKGSVVRLGADLFHAKKDRAPTDSAPPNADFWESIAGNLFPPIFLENRISTADLHKSGSGRLFGLIDLSAATLSGGLEMTRADGSARTPPPVFRIDLPNRRTFWRYFNGSTHQLLTESAVAMPSSAFGAATLQLNGKNLPSPTPDLMPRVFTVAATGEKRLTTDIFIG